MPAYSFEALDAQGQTRKGVLDADTARSARGLLRAQALIPLSVALVGDNQTAASWRKWLGRRTIFNANTLAVWTRQLAGLIIAGLPLERALNILAEEAETEEQNHLAAALRAEVNAGASFARALATQPREFSLIYTAVIGAGEQSGQLGLVLDQLAADLEQRQALREKLIGAALYPAIVTGIAIIVVTFLVIYVVPQIAAVFTGTKRTLPMLTTLMLSLSAFMRTYGWVLLGAVLLTALGIKLALTQKDWRLCFDALWLRLPLLGRLTRDYNATRFAGTLAMLTGTGVPILRALQAAAETLGNRAMRADALDAVILVREGAPLALALAQRKRFPGLLAMFARLGEQTGELPQMLQRAASQLGAGVQRRALHLVTILEPLLIVAMGGFVLLIVLAVLLPIIQLNQFVK